REHAETKHVLSYISSNINTHSTKISINYSVEHLLGVRVQVINPEASVIQHSLYGPMYDILEGFDLTISKAAVDNDSPNKVIVCSDFLEHEREQSLVIAGAMHNPILLMV